MEDDFEKLDNKDKAQAEKLFAAGDIDGLYKLYADAIKMRTSALKVMTLYIDEKKADPIKVVERIALEAINLCRFVCTPQEDKA